MEEGWVSIYRKFQEHEFWLEPRKFSKAEAWLYLIFQANHKGKKWFCGSELVFVERGSLITSMVKLSEKWKWDRRTVKKFLEYLESSKMCTVKYTTKYTSITIVNYDFYQNNVQPNVQQKHNQIHNKMYTNNNVINNILNIYKEKGQLDFYGKMKFFRTLKDNEDYISLSEEDKDKIKTMILGSVNN